MKRKKKKLKKSVLWLILIFLIVGIGCVFFQEYKNKEERLQLTYDKILTTKVGNKIDLLENVIVKDKEKQEIEVTVEGNYDFDKAGEYQLYYVVKDRKGHQKKEEFVLKVVEDSTKTSSNSEDKNHFTTNKGFKGEIIDGATYIEGTLIANKTYSLPATYGSGLTTETKEAFNKLRAAALLDGLDIYIASGYRSYERQVTLYDNYVKRDGKAAADTYSARPGHSEHQTGLTFDVNEVSDKFHNTPEANWLSDNCYKFGFILRFPNGKQNETGFKYESWHFRYVGKELAEKLYNNGDWLTLEGYFGITSEYQD